MKKENEKSGKMKEFFRPTKGKIALTIAMLLVTGFLLYLFTNSTRVDFVRFPNPVILIPLFIMALPIVALVMIVGYSGIEPFLTRNISLILWAVSFVIQVLYWYLLSCVVIHLTKKVRARK